MQTTCRTRTLTQSIQQYNTTLRSLPVHPHLYLHWRTCYHYHWLHSCFAPIERGFLGASRSKWYYLRGVRSCGELCNCRVSNYSCDVTASYLLDPLPIQDLAPFDDVVSIFAALATIVSGGGPLSTDLSLCLLQPNGPSSGQPFLCEPQYSGECW